MSMLTTYTLVLTGLLCSVVTVVSQASARNIGDPDMCWVSGCLLMSVHLGHPYSKNRVSL
jgi:hypothetical protein